MSMSQDQVLAMLAAARPLIAVVVGIGGSVGLYEASNDEPIVQGIIALVTAGVPLGMMIWGYLHSKNTIPTSTSTAISRVAVADATGVPVASVGDVVHRNARAQVAEYDKNGGVPAAK